MSGRLVKMRGALPDHPGAPWLLDAFCGAGGASMGYYQAGFNVVGVDIAPQPRYPFRFVQADAIDALTCWDLSPFAAIHASPPCQHYSRGTNDKKAHPALIPAVRDLLTARAPSLWVIENVTGAPLRVDLKLCGCVFGIPELRRERWFETSWADFDLLPVCWHGGQVVTVVTHGARAEISEGGRRKLWHVPHAEASRIMGVNWMTARELGESIPPVYGKYLGDRIKAKLM